MSTDQKPEGPLPPDTVAGMAQFYRTAERNIVRYRAKGAPVGEPMKFKEWIANQKSAPEGLVDRLEELAGASPVVLGENAADWEEFEKQARTEDPGEAMAKISKVRDWAFFQFERASRAKRKKEEKFYSDMLAKMEGTLHDAQLRAKQLGLQAGELVPRTDLETPARFLAYHLLRCADGALAKLAKALTEREPGAAALTVEEVRKAGEPLLITALVFEPMTRAMAGDNGASPPAWLVEAMRDGLAEVVEP